MTTTVPGRASWDLFCRVVDNFGDIGIAWRLARQIAADPQRAVRLFVDGLDAFARIEPRVSPGLAHQTIDRIEVLRWPADDAAFGGVASVVVELLGCGLPAACLEAMTRRVPVWIDFEHLSAERWVDDFHGLPSPHPRLPLVKHFFYPGFGACTGGLLVEPELARRRAAFLADPDAAAALWQRLGVPPPLAGEKRLSLFAYDDAPVDSLTRALSDEAGRWSIVVPRAVAGAAFASADARLLTVPFVDQPTYDQLLWACDVNFVRGEDSFVRAQAAGRPFVWQIYKQAEDAHVTKLDAFEARYEADLAPQAAAAQRALWHAWNGLSPDSGPALRAWLAELPALRRHAERWRQRLADDEPLIDRLVAFAAAPGARSRHRIC